MASASDDLFRDWDNLLEQSSETPIKIPNLENSLIEWSVKATLAALYGSRTDKVGLDLEDLILHVKGVFAASAELQSLSAKREAEKNTGNQLIE